MPKKKKKGSLAVQPLVRPGAAKAHGSLVDDSVHVFVDDQNLFWGLLNDGRSRAYRIDFGRMLTSASKDVKTPPRTGHPQYCGSPTPRRAIG
jgi:hypothetical protein